ncbi:MAG TPA: hypothetical protein DCR93_11815, partial [Cytophagales bacterium]|nr:hypothetical protein [Cytophagales bacterium]
RINYDYEGLRPDSLSSQSRSIQFTTNYDNSHYTGPITQAPKDVLRAELHNPLNWTRSNSIIWPASFPDFTLGPLFPLPGTALAPGDLAFTAFNSDVDGFSFALLVPIDSGTEINFTDQGWDGTQLAYFYLDLRTTWRATEALPAGTRVTISGGTATTGTLSQAWNSFSDNDNIFAYQGSVNHPQFIAGLHTGYWQLSGGINYDYESALPAALSDQRYHVSFTNFKDNGQARISLDSGTVAQWLVALHNPANWYQSNTGGGAPYGPNDLVVSSQPATWPGTPLEAGDIAIVGYQTDVIQRLAWVTFKDLAPGTLLIFNDNGWEGGKFGTHFDDYPIHWLATDAVPAGTVVVMDGSTATTGMQDGGLGYFIDPDQMYVYQGGVDEPRFITAFNTRYWTLSGIVDSNLEGLRPDTLTEGLNAMSFPNQLDNGYYNVPITGGELDSMRADVYHTANWTRSNSIVWWAAPPEFRFGGDDLALVAALDLKDLSIP